MNENLTHDLNKSVANSPRVEEQLSLWSGPLVHRVFALFCFFLAYLGPKNIRRIAVFLGILSFDVLRIRRSLILQNLSYFNSYLARMGGSGSKSPAQLLACGRESTIRFVQTTLEFLASPFLFAKQSSVFEGAEHVNAALQKGRGAYFLSLHLGNFEFGCSYLSKNFRTVRAITKLVGRGSIASFVMKIRHLNGEFEITALEKGRRAREIKKALERQEFIGFMVDQRKNNGMLVPFMDRLCLTNTGLFFLWKLKEAPILPIYCYRNPSDTTKHCVVVLPEIQILSQPDWSADRFLYENSVAINTLVAELIARHPEDYFWMHNRFKGSVPL